MVTICDQGGSIILDISGLPKIKTSHDYPPIPERSFDWSAVTDNYDLGHPIGHGATEAEAIADLKQQLEENEV